MRALSVRNGNFGPVISSKLCMSPRTIVLCTTAAVTERLMHASWDRLRNRRQGRAQGQDRRHLPCGFPSRNRVSRCCSRDSKTRSGHLPAVFALSGCQGGVRREGADDLDPGLDLGVSCVDDPKRRA